MLILLLILVPLVGAILSPHLTKPLGRHSGWGLATIPAAAFVALLLQVGSFGLMGSYTVTKSWIPSLDIGLDFSLDGLGLLFALMISGVGTFVFAYAGGYLENHPMKGRFFAFLLLFMTGMLGIASADNVILFFIFWELTSISSYLLIGFNHEDSAARKKALQALLVTGGGGVAMMAGLILLSQAGNSFNFSELVSQGTELASHPLAKYALPLLLLGTFTKSAQFPFQFWLPNAMAAPTPVSAYLHSATMVKAGVFLLFKLSPVYATSSLWVYTLVVAGAITLLLGAITGLFQRDLKRILAFTTMSVLGMLVMLIGLGGETALKSALLFMLGHSLYKATLFMTAGNVDHGTGTRDVGFLGGLRFAMPLTALAAGLAALSKGGFPPLLGFISKEYVYKASSELNAIAPLLTAIALIGNALLLALAFKAGIHPYWSKAREVAKSQIYSRFLPNAPHEAPVSMTLGPLILASCGLAFAFLPSAWTSALIAPALSATLGKATEVKIALWHGLNLPLLLSALTLLAGLLIYLAREYFWRKQILSRDIENNSTERIYDFAFSSFVEKSKELTQILQNGSLRFYLWVILAVSGSLLTYKLILLGGLPNLPGTEGITILNTAVTIAILVASAYTAQARNLIKALAGLGVIGYGIALIYALNGAPDLAITQIIVETLTVALLLYAALKLPSMKRYSTQRCRRIDALFAILGGSLATVLVLKAANLELASTISTQLSAWSYPLAKGRNVVNVILVDFRALDTLGEIAVLGIAALGVVLCLQKANTKNASKTKPETSGLIFQTGARILLPLCVALSLIALYRGHNEPGGGFIGGLIFAAGFILYGMAFDEKNARRKLQAAPSSYIGTGLLIAIASGLFGPFIGRPFMSALWLPDFSFPLLGKVHLGTPLLFDVGVFLTVIGFTLKVVFSFQSAANRSDELSS